MGPEHLARAHEAIHLAAGGELAARMMQSHLHLLQLEIQPIHAPGFAPCRNCGAAGVPVVNATFRRNIGLFYVRYASEESGNFCKPCAVKKSLTDNGIMLVCGWWGFVSLLIAPVYFVQNLANLIHVVRHARPEVDPAITTR